MTQKKLCLNPLIWRGGALAARAKINDSLLDVLIPLFGGAVLWLQRVFYFKQFKQLEPKFSI